MAIVVTNGPLAANKSSAATLQSSTWNVAVAVGNVVIVFVGADNAGTSGASSISGVHDSKGNTYTLVKAQNRTAGSAANDGCTAAIYMAKITVALTTSDTVTVDFSPNTTAKCMYCMKVTGVNRTAYSTDSASGSGATFTGNASPSMTSGDVIFALAVNESTTTPTLDSDTTNGSWNAFPNQSSSGGGADASNVAFQGSWKVVTGAGAQTYNAATGASTDWAEVQALFHVAADQTVTAGVTSVSLSTFAPVVTATSGVKATPDLATLVLTKYAPTIQLPRVTTPPVKALALSTFAPVARAPRVTTPALATLALTRYAPTILTPRLVTVPLASLSLATFAPTLPQLVVPDMLALSLTRYAPIVATPRLVTPSTVALVATRYAPTIIVPRLVTVPVASLSLAAFAPTLPRLTTPDAVALTLTTFAPTLPTLTTPDTAALSLSTFASTVFTPRLVTPDVLALALSAFAPSALTPRVVTPALTSLSLSTFAPSLGLAVISDRTQVVLLTFAPEADVTSGEDIVVAPVTVGLSLNSLKPTIYTPRLVTPSTDALHLSTFAPRPIAPRVVIVPAKSLTTAPYAPTIHTPRRAVISTLALHLTTYRPQTFVPRLVTPPTRHLSLTPRIPTARVHYFVTPATTSLTTTRYAPTIRLPHRARPSTAHLHLTGYQARPIVPRLVTPAAIHLTLTPFSPSFVEGIFTRPLAAHMVLTGFAVTVTATQTLGPARLLITVGGSAIVPSIEGVGFGVSIRAANVSGIVDGARLGASAGGARIEAHGE